MKNHWRYYLFLPLLIVIALSFSSVFHKIYAYQIFDGSCHDDHLNDATDTIPNNYAPFIIPLINSRQITISPVITCTCCENDTWVPNYHPCKMAQTVFVDYDWSDGDANYTYTFEDWIDYDWNDIVVNLYASNYNGISSELLLSFREAGWKNPLSIEITPEDTWTLIIWNSTDYPQEQYLNVSDGQTVELNLFAESNPSDKAFIRFLIPPVASFLYQPATPLVGETIVFDASASYDPDKEIETYSWIFSGNASINTSNPVVTRAFQYPGIYNVTLKVIDSDGLIGVFSKHVKVVMAVIGGETFSLDSAPIAMWRNINIVLIIAFAVVATFIRRKGKYSTSLH